MKRNKDLIIAQRGLTLLSFLPMINSKYGSEPAHFISAACYKAISKFKPNIFEVKCISSEYFEYLLSVDQFKIDLVGDIKSCALLSIDSLAVLSLANKTWLKIQEFDNETSILNQIKDIKEDYLSDSNPLKEEYFLQCFAVSSIRRQFVLYVTYEKYFNILQTLNKEACQNFTVQVDRVTNPPDPVFATHINLGYISCGVDMKVDIVEKLVKEHFNTPKNLKINEVLHINVQKILPDLSGSVQFINVKNISFKVLNVTNDSIKGTNKFGFYIVNKLTDVTISGATTINSFLPREYTKFIFVRGKESYEIPICPGGLDEYFLKLTKIFEFFLKRQNSRLKPMILLKGMKGSGKKTVLKYVAKSLGLKFFSFNCFDFIKFEFWGEEKFDNLLRKVQKMAPVILHLENIEFVGRDENFKEDVILINGFQNMLCKIFNKCLHYPVIIVASCSKKIPDLLPSIERYFIQTLSFQSMKGEGAEKLLNWLIYEAGITCYQEVVKAVVERVKGYVFADIVKLVRLALKYHREDETISEDTALLLTMDHMEKALRVLESNYSDSIGSVKVPSVHWEDVGGLEKLKEEITISLNFSSKYPNLNAELRASGFLFYGPPGTGKTLMAKAVATEFNYNFLSVKGPELMNKYVGQSEKNVREVFQQAREAAPCIIFFDELDSLAPNRGRESNSVMDKIVSQLLTEMDGLESNVGVFVIGATNRPDLIDPALLRPGRFDKMFYVGICSTAEMKLDVIRALTRRFSLGSDVDLEVVVNKLPIQVTGADLYSICTTSWVEAARRYVDKMNQGEEVELPVVVELRDFKKAVAKFVPSLTPIIIQSYERFKSMER